MSRWKGRTAALKAAAARLRTPILVIGGLTCVDFGVSLWSRPLGWVAGGVSLLIMDWLSGDEEKPR